MMYRKPHILSVLKNTRMPERVVFFDTETKNENAGKNKKRLVLKMGYAVCHRFGVDSDSGDSSECVFTDSHDFHVWLVSQTRLHKPLYVTAHNIGFDVRVTGTLKYLARSGWQRGVMIEDGLNFMVSFRKGQRRIQFLNNQQLFNVSLKQLGKSIGIEKKEVDFDRVDDETLLDYCKRDVEIMVRAWQKWLHYITKQKLGGFKPTVASQSLSAYRTAFMKHKIHIHTNSAAIALERQAYYGGRVECFFIGKYDIGKVYCVDVNSMYPYVMQYPVPVRLLRYETKCTVERFNRYRKNLACIARATFNIERACLPVRRKGKSLCFPVGRISGVFALPEIERALHYGRLLSVSEVAWYDEKPVFNSFVRKFYADRKEYQLHDEVAFAYITKLLMNSLYGKFGQRNEVYKKAGFNPAARDGVSKVFMPGRNEPVNMRVMDGIIEIETGKREAHNAFVAIAAYITSRARVYLDELIEKCGDKNVLYCDTDSLFVTEEGFNKLKNIINPAKLGGLKVEGENDSATFRAAKIYDFGKKSVTKGIRANAVLVSEGLFEQDKFMGFGQSLRTGNFDGVLVERVRKRLHFTYDKGIIQPDGWVKPLVIA